MMKSILFFLTLAAGIVNGQTNPNLKEKRPEWIALVDSHSLTGWTPEKGAIWRISEGVIFGDAGQDGWLRSSRQFKNFLLKIEYRNSLKGNSGVFLRATKESNLGDPSNPSGSYELQINNEDEKWPTGSIENFIQRLVPVTPAPNQWHQYNVEARGDHIMAELDGTKVLDGHDPTFQSGYIGLQHHKDNKIEFRNILVKRLPN